MNIIIFFFFKQKTAQEIMPSLVGSEMCIRDRILTVYAFHNGLLFFYFSLSLFLFQYIFFFFGDFVFFLVYFLHYFFDLSLIMFQFLRVPPLSQDCYILSLIHI
eukprot:TRINITY_DN22175_c0_g1_i1.p2 TRINITY_DN22175_c0_g1~~TRINITY_DN22175_c0_g1_i1.p2  ORF type:complete len:104 (+),score=9.27 TRINITY_DN22175_c0_g1_i1:66-377(+)